MPLKFGHNDDQPLTDGAPALGWVKRIYREGSKLLADFADIPSIVYEAIKRGLYKFVSIELLGGVKADTRIIPWVLDAVALLGADQPAVGTLKDLQALTMRRAARLRGGSRVAFRRAVNFSKEAHAMTEDEINRLIEKATSPLKKQIEDADAATKAEFARRDKEKADAEAAHKKELAKIKRERIDERFNRAIEAGALLPAKREQFMKFSRLDDDANVEALDLKDVETYITENSDKTKLTRKDPTSGGGDADKEPEDLHEKIKFRAARLMKDNRLEDNWQNRQRAIIEVLKADKDLAEKYKYSYGSAA